MANNNNKKNNKKRTAVNWNNDVLLWGFEALCSCGFEKSNSNWLPL